MAKPKLNIRIANMNDHERVANFRIEQYKTAKEFKIVDIDALTRQRGKVLLIELDGNIVSTMQMEIVENRESFNIIETAFIPADFFAYPTTYLSKAATLREFRNVGLNSLLRKLVIEDALEMEDILSITGTAYENAPRIHLLTKLGYDIVEIPPDVNYAKPIGKELFLCLKRDKCQLALQLLNAEIEELEDHFDWVYVQSFTSPHII